MESSYVVDLHMHTSFSDGVLTPIELINKAIDGKVSVMAITDHDTVKGVLDAKNLKVEGIKVVYGIELSTAWQSHKEIHVACYLPQDADYASFQQLLDRKVAKLRIDGKRRLIENLQKHGIDISWEEVQAQCINCLPSRPLIAKLLIKKGYASNMNDAFQTYLSEGSEYYCSGDKLTLPEAVEMIHSYHGILCLAHPWLLTNPEEVIDYAASLGFEGLECFPHFHHPETGTTRYIEKAEQLGLIPSSGSDYHGTKEPDVQPGANIFPKQYRRGIIDLLVKRNMLVL